MVVGGNKIDYLYNVSTPASNLITVKCIINSSIPTLNAKVLCADVKYFCLDTEIKRYECRKLIMVIVPQEIIDQGNLEEIKIDG